jgi:hypothetical protein
MNSWAAEDLKPGMFPGFQQINMIRSDLTFREMQGKDLGFIRMKRQRISANIDGDCS